MKIKKTTRKTLRTLSNYGWLEEMVRGIRQRRPLDLNAEAWRDAIPNAVLKNSKAPPRIACARACTLIFPSAVVIEVYFSFDTAPKTNTYNDFTAGCLVMRCQDVFVYILPLMLDRLRVPEIEKKILVLWAHWKEHLGQALRGRLIEEGAGTALVQIPAG